MINLIQLVNDSACNSTDNVLNEVAVVLGGVIDVLIDYVFFYYRTKIQFYQFTFYIMIIMYVFDIFVIINYCI